MAKNLVNIPYEDRPYEKLEKLGEEKLTNSELLAIIIKTGIKGKTCVDIAKDILTSNNLLDGISDLEYLKMMSINTLKNFKGIGKVKAIQIKAVIELSRRIMSDGNKKKKKISSPKDAFDIVQNVYINKKQEEIRTILLDNANNVLCIVNNCIGKTSSASITLKELLSEPIKQMASSIILVHNHPSGDLHPSKQDISFTNKIYEYSQIFDIALLDHIIVNNNSYMSLKEKGYF